MVAHFGLAFASPPSQNDLGLPLTITRRLIKQKARHHRAISKGYCGFRKADCGKKLMRAGARLLTLRFPVSQIRIVFSAFREDPALTPCKHIISGTISLRSQRFFSPFPRGTCSLSVAN